MEKNNEKTIRIMFLYKELEYPFFVKPNIEFNVLDLKVKSIIQEFDNIDNYKIYFLSKEGKKILISNDNDLKEGISDFLLSKNDTLKCEIINKDDDNLMEHSQIISEEKNKLKESFNIDNLNYSILTLSKVIPKDPCIKCGQNIENIKYICMICNNYILCENCYSFHSEFHPMVLSKKKNFFPTNLNYLGYLINNKNFKLDITYKINMKLFSIDQRFAMKKNSYKCFNIIITNLGNYISEEIIVNFINTNDIISVKPRVFSNLKKEEKCLLKIEINSYNILGDIFPSIEIYCEKAKIKHNPIKLEIKVIKDENYYDENVDMLLREFPNLKTLSRINKFKLYNAIKNNQFFDENIVNIDKQVKHYGEDSLFPKKKKNSI